MRRMAVARPGNDRPNSNNGIVRWGGIQQVDPVLAFTGPTVGYARSGQLAYLLREIPTSYTVLLIANFITPIWFGEPNAWTVSWQITNGLGSVGANVLQTLVVPAGGFGNNTNLNFTKLAQYTQLRSVLTLPLQQVSILADVQGTAVNLVDPHPVELSAFISPIFD